MKYRRALLLALCITAFFNGVLGKPWSYGGRRSGKLTTQKVEVTSKSNAKETVSPNAEAAKVGKTSSGSILSAWGIISLIMFVIGSSFIIYYFSIFYPMICAKRGKYDIMEMASV